MTSILTRALPRELEAQSPPESRGLRRDGVRMLVAYRHDGRLVHARFRELSSFLAPGDLLVINTSATLPAAVQAVTAAGETVELHFSTRLPAGLWSVELRSRRQPSTAGRPGLVLSLPGGAVVELLAPQATSTRLWIAAARLPGAVEEYLKLHGAPIRYRYVDGDWPIDAYQTVYATEPGSAEMPSAGRPFTPEMVTELVTRGIGVVPLVLHTGVSSVEAGEPPYAERYRVSGRTAHQVNDARRQGGRVVAVGTTVVRALETVADEDGRVHAGEGWTERVVTAELGVRAVDGMLTGWHEPRASHLAMLEAVAGRQLLEASYQAAVDHGYLWHEFGDTHLILP